MAVNRGIYHQGMSTLWVHRIEQSEYKALKYEVMLAV